MFTCADTFFSNLLPCSMSLQIAALNSGSNGNCYYIGNENEAVLVDAGISCREIEKRMKNIGLSIRKVKAIFVTHEHSDHIKGIPSIVKKYSIPVYLSTPTHHQIHLRLKRATVIPFRAYEDISIGAISIKPFPVPHDAADPHNFIVSNEVVKFGVFTDIGTLNHHVIQNFRECHAAILESNYDEEMLETGRYPMMLKNRIRGGQGHLSNSQAAKLLVDYKPAFMSHLLLGHLSKNNNKPEIVESLFKSLSGNTRVIIASRYKESDVYTISSKSDTAAIPSYRSPNPVQLKLF